MEFCQRCGAEISPNAAFCVACGAPVVRHFAAPASAPAPAPARAPVMSVPGQPKGRSFIVALVLCFSLGIFGVHRFYTGNVLSGIVQLLTCGGMGIWVLIDLISIVTDSYRDGDGRPLVHDEQ